MLLVFLMGILGIWKSVPLGFLIGLSPVWIGVMTILGAFVGVIVLYFLGSRTKKYVLARMQKKKMGLKKERLTMLFEKYGTAGIGLIGTLVIGPNATIAVGLALVKSDKRLLYWTLLGTAVWSAVLSVIGAVSVELFQKIVN